MGAFFSIGEQKIEPGSFIRYENTGGPQEVAVTNGIAAAVFKSNWGPLGTALDISNPTDRETHYGTANGTTNNSDSIDLELLGASTVKAIRVGTGGTKGTLILKDTAGSPANVITLSLKYPGTRAFSCTIKDSLTDITKRECTIYEGTKERQKFIFAKGGTGEVDALVAEIAKGSNWVTATKTAAGTGLLATINQSAFTGGTDPDITSADYSTAFTVLEALDWNVIAIDSDDATIQTLLGGYVSRVFLEGKLIRAVVGEPTSVALATRQTNAAAFNNFCMHYCLNGYKDTAGIPYEGWKAAARVAGIIAGAPANASLTHYVISGATALTETLSNPNIRTCLQKGAIVFTINSFGQVMIKYGINTLVSLTADMDEGWKKIRRVSTRFELMKRITGVTDRLIGKIDNNPDGRATLIGAAQDIINKMGKFEGKLLPGGTLIEDPSNPPAGDYAWFKIAVDDLDSGEKLYFTFGFRFAPAT